MKKVTAKGDAQFKASPKHSKLKLASALTMILPTFLGTGQKAFAINNVDSIPKTTTAQGYGKMQAWATVKTPSGQEALHNGWHDQNNTRYYCLDPVKMTPGKYGTSSKAQYNGHEGKGAIKKVLITGYGANSAEWLNNKSGLNLTADQWEYATQVAVWVVGQSASKDVTWHDATVKKGYDYIMKNYPNADMQEDTTLKLKVVKNDSKTTKTLQAETLQIGKHYDETVSVKADGVKLTQGGKTVTNKLKSNTNFTATLTDPNSGKGSITVSANKYSLDFPIYDPVSTNAQRGIAVIGVKKGTMTDTYSWGSSTEKLNTPPKTEKTPGKGQFDLIKKDDDGKAVAEVKFDVYDETNGHKLIGTITTDKTGIAKSAELPFGKYQAIEKSTSKNLQVDSTPV